MYYLGTTHSWRGAECLFMPSPSRSRRTTPGTAATSGLSSLLRICKDRIQSGFCAVNISSFRRREHDYSPLSPTAVLFSTVFLFLPHSEGDLVSLHLLQLAFSERKCLASGKILYEVWRLFPQYLLIKSRHFSAEKRGMFFSHRVWNIARSDTVRI